MSVIKPKMDNPRLPSSTSNVFAFGALFITSSFGMFTLLVNTTKFIENLPEKEDSLKHKFKHWRGLNEVDFAKYWSTSGREKIGSRCVVCGKISSGDESVMSREPEDDKATRLIRKEFLEMNGPKGDDAWKLFLLKKKNVDIITCPFNV